jgi:hypothetical protein
MNKNISFTIFHISAIPYGFSFAHRHIDKSAHRLIGTSAHRLIILPLTFIYIVSRIWGRTLIFCRRINFTDFSAPVASCSSTAARFALPYPHLTQVLQDLFFRSLIWFKSCKICSSVASCSFTATKFALPYPHLAQILQDLPFRSLIWFKSYKICPSVASFDIYKNFFKQVFRSIIKPKTGSQILYSNNLNYFLIS